MEHRRASGSILLRLDVSSPDHLAPFLRFLGDQLSKVGGRAGEHHTVILQDFLPRSGTNRHSRRTLRNKRFSRAGGTTADQCARSFACAPLAESALPGVASPRRVALSRVASHVEQRQTSPCPHAQEILRAGRARRGCPLQLRAIWCDERALRRRDGARD